MRNVIRAVRLERSGFSVAEIPDLSYALKICKFANARPVTFDLLDYYFNSPSQIHQDLLAHLVCREKYFVEFGACDGIESSNTYWLEKHNGWRGVLAEPGTTWFPKLEENRSATIIRKAVASVSGDFLAFADTENPVYSTFSNLTSQDEHAGKRLKYQEYLVETISLEDLLIESGAPNKIGYLSLDTEGSEFEILNSFNFDNFQFELISVEHNFTKNEKKIDELLESKGYIRILSDISGGDAWYLNRKLQE
jgi:FkbM family methyltransferase